MRGNELAGRLLAGRYRLTGQLGAGGMGAVYAAIDQRLGGKVAVKVILGGGVDSGDVDNAALARFRREARAAAALGNPHIVRITDFQENAGEPAFLVMEHIEGVSLHALIASDGRLPASRACAIAAQILHALAAAHDAGILHRDIKPPNVIISATPAGDLVKVIDFGLAGFLEAARGKSGAIVTHPLGDLSGSGEILGTLGYVAPEHLRRELTTARTDVYAVGATLFCMLDGQRPFAGSSFADCIARTLREVPRLDHERLAIDRALADVVARAMALRPEERYADAGALLTALEPWTGDHRRLPARGRPHEIAATATSPELFDARSPVRATRPTPSPPGGMLALWQRARLFVLAGLIVATLLMYASGHGYFATASATRRATVGRPVKQNAVDSPTEIDKR